MNASGLEAADEASPQPTVTEQLCQSVGHDLRGVLMAIQLSAEELTTPGVSVLELQGEIQASIERATELVSELTALAKPTGGHAEVFDVGPLIDQMQRMLRRNARPGTLVKLELARENCFVSAPRMAFKRVLLTLFNAVATRLPSRSTLAIETALVHDPDVGQPEFARSRVVVSLGDDASHARDWPLAERVPTEGVNAPGSEELFALVQRLGADLYCRGAHETSPAFWLCLPRVHGTRARL